MISFITLDDQGNILSTCTTIVDASIGYPTNYVPLNWSELGILEEDLVLKYKYNQSTGELVFSGIPPSPYHDWSLSALAWIPNLVKAKKDRNEIINSERDRRISLPLIYDGKNLDADARARENLKSKLEEIKSREALNQPMPQFLLVWRDADNVTHSWPTQGAYKTWLEGFTIAMSERGTLLYAAAWQHKKNIDDLAKLGDIDTILAYPVTEGWPV